MAFQFGQMVQAAGAGLEQHAGVGHGGEAPMRAVADPDPAAPANVVAQHIAGQRPILQR